LREPVSLEILVEQRSVLDLGEAVCLLSNGVEQNLRAISC
jgi:hypothetical protein